MKKIIQLLFHLVILCLGTTAFATTKEGTVYIIGTGGTIAGSADSKLSSQYESGKWSTQQLLETLPELSKLAHIKVIDYFKLTVVTLPFRIG